MFPFNYGTVIVQEVQQAVHVAKETKRSVKISSFNLEEKDLRLSESTRDNDSILRPAFLIFLSSQKIHSCIEADQWEL